MTVRAVVTAAVTETHVTLAKIETETGTESATVTATEIGTVIVIGTEIVAHVNETAARAKDHVRAAENVTSTNRRAIKCT